MKKKLIIIIPIIIAVVAFIFVYRYYNKEDATTTLTVREKQWVQEHADQTYDFEVVNNYPLYGTNGSGVIFSFLEDFEENIGLEFNRIPYLKESKTSIDGFRIRILDNGDKLKDTDLPLFNDNYVAVGKTYRRINSIKDFKNVTFGIFKEDSSEISYYLKSGTNLSFKTYDKIEDIYKALDNDEVDMVIVPNIMYLNYTIDNDKYSINYFFTEMQKQIVLTLSKDNKELNKIVTKYYNKWKQTKYVKEYNDAYLDYYLEENNLNAKTKAELISKNYTYGYVENPPYEQLVNGKVAGIAGEYVDRVTRLSGINFKYKKYDTIEDLEKAIDKGEVDLYFDYYNYNNNKYKSTLSTFIEKYVVLGKEEDNHIVTSFESMKDEPLAMLGNDSLYNYFSNNARAKIKIYDNIDELVKESGSRLIVVDKEIYSHYQTTKFKKLKLLYTDTMMNDYKFMVKNNNEAFYDLFNYIINTNSYYNYRNSGITNLHASILEGSTLEQVYTIVLTIIFVPLIILLAVYLIIKKKKQIKKVKASDRHKYTDMLTSLKNRNYLNAKMPEWEESKVFPQAIVMVDLNNVKYINDNYGHEEGDDLIIKAAGILVNTQLENSEIMRTDGNEFLIYLVGYSERQVSTYVKKLGKEMKNLPHEFGAAIGYSMITDEIKTLDDAINEATLEMITAKEEMK
ncbi:MAG: GGDEF domain-containing protein [bacterium]|nr:GGDEF domain-containing protein [Mycoplasmatota bacterium]MDD6757258.1 GGDEF domain-containing protein [bacterium]